MTLASSTAAILSIVLGALICFFGYRLLRVTLGIAGFVVGAALGGAIGSMITGVSQVFLLIIAVVCGIVGAILAAVLYKVGVFLLGAGAGMLIAGLVVAGTGNTPHILVLVAAGIVGGLITLLLQRTLVSILTAFGGAWGVAAGVFHLAGWYDLSAGYLGLAALRASAPHFGLMVICWIVLGILGSIAQLAGRRKRRR